MAGWRPGRNAQRLALEAPYEDVPDHLHKPLMLWISSQAEDAEMLRRVVLKMRLDVFDPTAGYQAHVRTQEELVQRANADPAYALDVVEAFLEDDGCYNQLVLEATLEQANSAYRVREDWRGLEMRVLPEVTDQVQQVVNVAAGSPGDHLTNAWNEAYSRTADPVKSYSESIKAAEAALAARITPQNAKQTLGTMIADVRNAPQNFKFDLAGGTNSDGVDTVFSMMRLLWEGQTSRHGGAKATRDETVEEARAAVHVAAALVQYGVTGAFQRR